MNLLRRPSSRTPSTPSLTSRRIARVAPVAVAALVVAVGYLYAGPLNPPPGAVASTYKTLTEVEPRIIINSTNTPGTAGSTYRITQPGSYYLIGNMTGESGKAGILIESTGCVTVDLMGFEVRGVTGAREGIVAVGGKNLEVRNGCVTNWPLGGIIAGNTTVGTGIIDDIRASDNLGNGIQVGNGFIVNQCVAYNNGVSTGPLTAGIWVSAGSTITDCTVYNNKGDGIFANTGCSVLKCTARDNVKNGIQVTTNCTVRDNLCTGNGFGAGSGAGILAGLANGSDGNNRIEGNHCTTADRGVEVSSTGNYIVRNICANNTTDWVIAATNCWAQIVDRRGVAGGAAVNGFSSPFFPLETDCCSNVSY